MHNTIIILVILIVVGFQAYVAYTAWKKIDFYQGIIPQPENFQTIKVYIPESQVKNIDINYVLNNPDKFGPPAVFALSETITEPEIINEPAIAIVTTETNQTGHEEYVWVAKDNEEKKIKYTLLQSHEQAGWNRI
ncbi:hypothetical protein AM493_01150 [Flavobacterium akiainvivens]|uniref:Uncharacterized protein n=1 Tax=Flavobacterium akiainvivens TaxID=1202724 RepID=A0A0M8M777_9FLAO|nr:hypothetical protein [Flavobacterium akiainvivens]KOS04803.1 hypothetical protein AM493_01150 [Flavobacterium akiainvivens]SFQ43943.1 hypothetical protein SAMN05444144_104297 [Flavobacterium akiainvivens]